MNVTKEQRLVGTLSPADLRRAVTTEGLHIPGNAAVNFYVMSDGKRIPITFGLCFEVILDAEKQG